VRTTADGRVCQCEAFAAVTERAALASGRWLGRGDVEGAAEAAISAMRAALDLMPIEGRIVIDIETGEPLCDQLIVDVRSFLGLEDHRSFLPVRARSERHNTHVPPHHDLIEESKEYMFTARHELSPPV